MICFIDGITQDCELLDYHAAMIGRSFPSINSKSQSLRKNMNKGCFFCISDNDFTATDLMLQIGSAPTKIVIFGQLPSFLIEFLGGRHISVGADWQYLANSDAFQSSELRVDFNSNCRQFGFEPYQRFFQRFDFSNEWNNYGYGFIQSGDCKWSIKDYIKLPTKHELATVSFADTDILTYSAYFTYENAEILWFNRLAGACDGPEWRMIELFFSSWKHSQFPCVPVIADIPYGYDMFVSMRLDCDEAIASSQILLEAYQQFGVPLSLAIKTELLESIAEAQYLRNFSKANPGCVLSHSHSHPENWGGDIDRVRSEVQRSHDLIVKWTNEVPHYAVSPFHQTTSYACDALQEFGYRGCIGGIVNSDPSYISFRNGGISSAAGNFIHSTQQVMLHGDCVENGKYENSEYSKIFKQYKMSRSSFCFLDHPFSDRYSYGWQTEDNRLDAHKSLLTEIRDTTDKTLFVSENEFMDFHFDKSSLELVADETSFTFRKRSNLSRLIFSVEYKGKVYRYNEKIAF